MSKCVECSTGILPWAPSLIFYMIDLYYYNAVVAFLFN